MKRSDCLKQSKIFKLRVRLSWARKIFWMLQSSSGRKWKKCEQTLLFIAMHHWGYTSLEVKSSYGYPLVLFRPDKEDSTVLSQDQTQGTTELQSLAFKIIYCSHNTQLCIYLQLRQDTLKQDTLKHLQYLCITRLSSGETLLNIYYV